MTTRVGRRVREQAALVLRCALDHEAGGIYGAAVALGHRTWELPGPRVYEFAKYCRQAVSAENPWLSYDEECLEAAQRLDEGWTP